MKRIKSKRVLIIIAGIFLWVVFTMVIHELGHCIPLIIKGGGVQRIVISGYEVMPDFGRNTHLGLVSFVVPKWPENYTTTNWWKGLMEFSGAGFTLFISLVSVILLWVIKPKSVLKFILIILAFGFWDILIYSFVPLMKLPFPQNSPMQKFEPLEGLIFMGLPMTYGLAFVFIMASIAAVFLGLYIKKYNFFNNNIDKIKETL